MEDTLVVAQGRGGVGQSVWCWDASVAFPVVMDTQTYVQDNNYMEPHAHTPSPGRSDKTSGLHQGQDLIITFRYAFRRYSHGKNVERVHVTPCIISYNHMGVYNYFVIKS